MAKNIQTGTDYSNSMNPWIQNPTVMLTTNHRQDDYSGIPEAAIDAREYGMFRKAQYGAFVRVLNARSDTAGKLIERYKPNATERTFLVSYNKTRSMLNTYFHEKDYGNSSPLYKGERLIFLERQEDVQELDDVGNVVNETLIHNGTLASVTNVISSGERYCEIELKLDNDWRGRESVNVRLKVATAQLGNPEILNYRNKPRYAALVDYAYALTVHRSQGSEFDQVIYWQEPKGDKRSAYTAVTRAKNALIILT